MLANWLELQGKTVVVTGGSSGIGDAIVRELVTQNVNVVNADLKEGKFQAKNLMFVQTDVTSPAAVESLVEQVVAKYGTIDGLVNNAGINLPRLLVDDKQPKGQYELTEAAFNKMFAVNVKSVFLMSQAVGRILVHKHEGVIVNMSSEAGLEGSIGQSVYSATKGAINSFTRSWAKELGQYNVRVVGIAPGIMEATGLRTPAYEEALAYTRHKTVEQLRAGYKSTSTTPLGRSGHLSEVADLVCYYLSNRSSYITGVTTNVAGGKSRG
ncbi:MAG: SDR family oxidoreductase [Loigolactobacillus coryniformis]|jgi:sorbitol-6-phosphate 2-dehydrogenase|uniref:SDR family oxidoreductase n=1 Tax=Loigolactobacillus coryniformis TaxID=1610 RepID=A0A5B8TKD1_9LACO|nr:SDR family oxidoreductase [Loigolactobacillus coryniformis]MCL5458859.1 SDR family oxidoreductase [Loigolactobacillus coryniformis]MDN5953847.1 SDR family oxidoreductase [Loigolactobacillus coryniformis]QEA54355.1 SDR family oxidoreductase [Loigolactobacillus coryniformis]